MNRVKKVLVTRIGLRTNVAIFRTNGDRRLYCMSNMTGSTYLRLMRVLDSMEHQIEITADRLAIRYFPNKGD